MKLSGARLLIEELIHQGVDTVFGYPGGAVLQIYDELYKCKDRIHHVLTAHEQGAAHTSCVWANSRIAHTCGRSYFVSHAQQVLLILIPRV